LPQRADSRGSAIAAPIRAPDITQTTMPSTPPTADGTTRTGGTGAPALFASGTRVVVAEDDLASRKLVCLLLQKLGLEAYPAADGRSAIDLVKQVSPHLVLMDLHMPVMNGPDAIRAMRADRDAPQPPVVILSADVFGDRDAHDLAALGAAEFLTKPVDRVHLHAMLARLLPHA
jgi:CheY-like chemotaxis protein